MNKKDPNTDSGKYVNGVYTSKNGFSNSGLNCPKGTRLYNTDVKQVVFFEPEDTAEGEEFTRLTQDAAPDVLPYYAISNYGRILNTRSGNIMKPNYRPNGYEYYCLAAENAKTGQKKYSTHRLVLKTFDPRENMDNLQVNHIHGDKTQNYINKIMPDGTVDSGIEWCTASENSKHAVDTLGRSSGKLSFEDATKIRKLHDEGYSYGQINFYHYPEVSLASIQNICLNRTYKDENYTPKSYYDSYKKNPGNTHRLTDEDARKIRGLYSHGFNCLDIKNDFYPDFSVAAISDIVRGITHNR